MTWLEKRTHYLLNCLPVILIISNSDTALTFHFVDGRCFINKNKSQHIYCLIAA